MWGNTSSGKGIMKDKEIREILKDKKKTYEICSKLGISDREWRRVVKEYNDGFETRERLIVSDKDGYEITTNKKLIKRYAIKLINHALSELLDAKHILKVLKDKDQLKLIDDEPDLVDICMKLRG